MAKGEDELVFPAARRVGRDRDEDSALYGFGPLRDRKWLMVDLGVAFAGEDLPGIDLIMPGMSAAEEIREEPRRHRSYPRVDHFGAVADLWPKLGVPILCTNFAADLLEVRRLSEPGAPKVPIRRIAVDSRFSLGPFDIEMVPVAHSNSRSCAMAIRTPLGTVVHTGDWKIDETPVLGLPTNGKRLAEIGDEVLALICDSTNITRDGISPSERRVAAGLKEIILASPGRARHHLCLQRRARSQRVQAAQAAGRGAIVAGRAMERVVQIGAELGMLKGLPAFRSIDAFPRIPRDKVVVLVTGSQGEQRAALARIAAGEYPDIKLTSGDRVIFSSRPIPGNEKDINKVVNTCPSVHRHHNRSARAGARLRPSPPG